MRICINVLIITVAFLCFSSCGTSQIFDETFEKSDVFESNSNNVNQKQELNEISDTLLIALESKDEKTIKNLMAPKLTNTSETLTTEIQCAFEFFEGNVISCENIKNVSEGEKYDKGKLIYLRI